MNNVSSTELLKAITELDEKQDDLGITQEGFEKFKLLRSEYIQKIIEVATDMKANPDKYQNIPANPPLSINNYNPYYIEHLVRGGKPEDFSSY